MITTQGYGGGRTILSPGYRTAVHRFDAWPAHAIGYVGHGIVYTASLKYNVSFNFELSDGFTYHYFYSPWLTLLEAVLLLDEAENYVSPDGEFYGIGEWFNLLQRRTMFAKVVQSELYSFLLAN